MNRVLGLKLFACVAAYSSRQVIEYLLTTPAGVQSVPKAIAFLKEATSLGLTEVEKLQALNLRPALPVEVHLVSFSVPVIVLRARSLHNGLTCFLLGLPFSCWYRPGGLQPVHLQNSVHALLPALWFSLTDGTSWRLMRLAHAVPPPYSILLRWVLDWCACR